MRLSRYLGRRLIQFLLVIWGASLILFLAFHVVTDPVRTMLPLGTPESTIERVNEQLGFNDPLLVQYVDYLKGAFTGDFGVSLWLQQPALPAVIERIPVTAFLVINATLLGTVVGTTLGVVAARKPGSFVDGAVNLLSYLMVSLPHYWLALVFILVFSVNLGWFPTSGYEQDLSYAVLPVVTLSLIPMGRTAQLVRAGMIDEAKKHYSVVATAKGLSQTRVAISHQLRNVAVPLAALVFYDLGHLFVGEAVIVETIFAWPGIGRLAIGALSRGDIFLAQAIVFVAAIVIASSNLVADVLGLKIDPRIRDSLGRRP